MWAGLSSKATAGGEAPPTPSVQRKNPKRRSTSARPCLKRPGRAGEQQLWASTTSETIMREGPLPSSRALPLPRIWCDSGFLSGFSLRSVRIPRVPFAQCESYVRGSMGRNAGQQAPHRQVLASSAAPGQTSTRRCDLPTARPRSMLASGRRKPSAWSTAAARRRAHIRDRARTRRRARWRLAACTSRLNRPCAARARPARAR